MFYRGWKGRGREREKGYVLNLWWRRATRLSTDTIDREREGERFRGFTVKVRFSTGLSTLFFHGLSMGVKKVFPFHSTWDGDGDGDGNGDGDGDGKLSTRLSNVSIKNVW
jgi:hypothetical protein